MTFSTKIHTFSPLNPPNFNRPPKIPKFSRPKTLKFPISAHLITQKGDEIPRISSRNVVSPRLVRLVAEFRSLSTPIDRVKRLLSYAAALPRLGESTRSPENRVRGCAAEVWLEVERDNVGRMKFGADSDSEITKGFCSCLIFLLDGAFPHDVLKVKAEDLTDMNVGLPVRSRVNSWHNVLVNMQERTKPFLSEKDEEVCQRGDHLDTFPSLVVPPDTKITKGEVCVS
ncbi:hypothetical protein vseg_015273 [Gypsophila vaccaria]